MGRVLVPVVMLICSLQVLADDPCGLPKGVTAKFDAALGRLYERNPKLRPCYLKGDFDGDRKPDYAVPIRERRTGKSGIAILNSSTGSWALLAAGFLFNGYDDMSWMDVWSVYPKGRVERGVEEGPPPRLKGDAIMAEKSESASGLIYWTGKRYHWYQQGD